MKAILSDMRIHGKPLRKKSYDPNRKNDLQENARLLKQNGIVDATAFRWI